jgi:hypothetical protein
MDDVESAGALWMTWWASDPTSGAQEARVGGGPVAAARRWDGAQERTVIHHVVQPLGRRMGEEVIDHHGAVLRGGAAVAAE